MSKKRETNDAASATCMPRPRRIMFGRVAPLCLLMVGTTAWAEANPYSLGASLTLGSDNNLFRAPAADAVSDRYLTASVFAGVDQRISRQRIEANVALHSSHYRERGDLDNTGHGLRLGWSGATAGEISWNLSYGEQRSLASYIGVVDPALRVANMETNRQALASVQVGLRAQWLANVTLTHRTIDYSAASYAAEEVRLDAIGLGVKWNPLGPLSVSVGPRHTRGRYPQGRAVAAGDFEATGFERDDIDLGVTWVATGASTITARLSATRQQDDELSERDFNGATGQLGWQWAATGKTRVNTTLSRDTGSETSFFTLPTPEQPTRGTGDNSRLTNAVAVRIDHELTGKITLGLGGGYAERQLSATTLVDDGSGVLVASTESGRERSGNVSLGLRYAPTRNSLVACSLGHARRAARTSLSSPYRVDTASCSVQMVLQQ
jgi:hypothetical protein